MPDSNNSSKNENQKIAPQSFDAPGLNKSDIADNNAAKIESQNTHTRLEIIDNRRWWHSQFNLMLAVFSLLVIASLLFVSLSPKPSSTSYVTLVKQDGDEVKDSAAVKQESAEDQAPWDEQRRAQARVDAQDILSGLLNNKKILEAQDVQQWAGQEYQSALEQADSGDNFYKQQDYRSAIDAYQDAAQQMQSLQTRLPEILKERIRDGLVALEQGQSAIAKQQFQQALALDRNSISALKGLGRAETLDQVIELYAQGQDLEQQFKTDDRLESLQAATQKYQQALELDKDYVVAQQAIDRLSNLDADKRYRQSMTKGFNSLFAKRYSSAKSAFSKALKIKPNDVTAKEAYTQSQSSNRSASLTSVLSTAKKHEANEEWSSALSNYQAVLQRDANQVSAKLGQIRSRARSDLDERLVTALSDPLALSKGSVRDKAKQALADARGISRKGVRLNKQIKQLELALSDLNQTIKIVISSDSQTQVSIVKQGSKRIDLGKFSTKNLSLKPGRYVIRGVRLGFQDVRKEIDVLPGTLEVESISISCTESVGGAVNNTATTNQGWG